MTQEELKQTLKNKLKECDKDTLVDIIADVCLIYVGARALVDLRGGSTSSMVHYTPIGVICWPRDLQNVSEC